MTEEPRVITPDEFAVICNQIERAWHKYGLPEDGTFHTSQQSRAGAVLIVHALGLAMPWEVKATEVSA